MNDILSGLDPSQRQAAMAVEGPVRIIAGAGAGKTRTIMRRIAYACRSGAWREERALAVTFSVKAAGEMQERLRKLGIQGVQAATFHSAALGQLRQAWGDLSDAPFPQVSDNLRDLVIRSMAKVTGESDFQDIDIFDVQAEIDRMKVGLILPAEYGRLCQETGRTPPAGLDQTAMKAVMDAYEEEKVFHGVMDFNDILLLLCHVLEKEPDQAARIRKGIGWLTVDEYQDVSPLQHRLMTLWLGENRNVCVVGDAAQTIYSFAGATSYYLNRFDWEFAPLTADISLNRDYRSTPTIVAQANALLEKSPLRDDYLHLASGREPGRKVLKTRYSSDVHEARGIAGKIKRLMASGAKAGDIAVLMRINNQSRLLSSVFKEEGIPFRVRRDSGWDSQTSHDSLLNADGTVGQVTLSTIHASKGLEWPYVFIMGCSDGLIPYATNMTDQGLEEERRLLYVGVTRAEDFLEISYSQGMRKEGEQDSWQTLKRYPSRFLR